MKKYFIAITLLSVLTISVFAENDGLGIGSDAAFPEIEKVLKSIPITKEKIYTCNDEEVKKLITRAAEIEINIFELLDCTYRYLNSNKMRIEIKGSSLQKLMNEFDYGEERILAIIPIPLIDKIYTGFNTDKKQKALQIFLTQEYKNYIEIGTALYEKEFGFNKLEPNSFSDSYGMKVKKFGIKMRIKKIHLYQKGKGAIYAGGLSRPKRWYLWLITKIKTDRK